MSEQTNETGQAGTAGTGEQAEAAAPTPEFGANGEVTLGGVTFPPPEGAGKAEPAAAVATEVKVDPVAPEPAASEESDPAPPADPFSPIQLQNGDFEVKLPTGQVFTGKSERELLTKLAQSKVQSEQYIQELKGKAAPAAVEKSSASPEIPGEIDPTALAVADLMAPAFGFKSGKEMNEALKQLQARTDQFQTVAQEATLNRTAAEFFAAAPDFVPTPANSDKIEQTLQQYGLPPTKDNLLLVHNALKGQGAYEAKPAAATATTPASATLPRTPSGQFAPRPTPPANPLPPTSTVATTGAGTPSESDLWAMPADKILEMMQSLSAA